jgi:hypothetical protein
MNFVPLTAASTLAAVTALPNARFGETIYAVGSL